MTCFAKRRITTNLLQVALLLLYLRGDFPATYNHRNNFNISNPEYNLGPSWGYAQTNFHRNNYDGINIHPKSVHSFEQNYLEFSDNDILDVIRSHSINSFRSHISAITKVSDAVPSFQDVTAYLLSNTSASFSNLPQGAPVDRHQLLSVNVDVPRSSDQNDRNDTTTFTSEIIFAEDDSENHFHLISGNIVFLPESEPSVNNNEQVLAHPLINSNDDSSIEEAVINAEIVEGATSSQATTNAEIVAGEASSDWSSSFSGLEPTEQLWDQLQNDMDQLLDEDFSLGLAFADDMLAMGDVLAAETAQNRFEDDSSDDELTMAAIPPLSLHYDDLWESDSGIFDSLLEITPDGTSAASALLEDLETGVLALSEESESGPSSPDLSEDLNNILVQAVEESGQSSSGSIPETSDEEGSELIEGLEMIQTASIYANARPTSHPAQQRSFQVHARMQGLLRGSSMDQRWQELASLLSLQPQHDQNGTPLPPPLPHHFPSHHHHHHHLHHPTSSLHHHSMHHPPFSSAGPPAVPYPDTTRSVLLQNASLPVPPPEINATSSYPNVAMGPPPNLGSALASSMHITNSSDPMIDPSSHYKMIEPTHHEMLYYPNMTSNAEMSNQTTEGFLSQILNEDDLQLMDMAMNEGMYQMRPMDSSSGAVGIAATASGQGVGIHPGLPHQSNCTIGAASVVPSAVQEDRMEASSDSAVSSMGSERVPPMTDPHISDNEWTDQDAHPHSSHDSNYTSDYASKLRGYDYYGKGDSIHRVGAPVAQKKHQMFGKRVQHDQGIHPYSLGPHSSSGLLVSYPSGSGVHQSNPGSMDSLEMKYSCSVDFVRHDGEARNPDGPPEIHNNHSYSLPQSHLPNTTLSLRSQRPPTKEKSKKEYLSRDEKRARALNLPLTTDDIINLPMDEFNERLSKYDLTESQLSLIRDIRRRGKNKVAAQNCRKRKLDQILQLAEEVARIRDKKSSLLREHENLAARRNEIREKYLQLYRTVFQALRDRDGNPYSPHEWSLQQAADGNMILVPRTYQPSTSGTSESIDSTMRRGKTKDEIKKDGQA
ncbi:unnamed protein product [Allacma fusca]|uniref:BZIP domain-containing protein n=1 Tax=Allacma fusca TaxID=39272 RepID=A0A8J2PPX4_9HEXA|nr:unnamed protein product [Allacma fusca]